MGNNCILFVTTFDDMDSKISDYIFTNDTKLQNFNSGSLQNCKIFNGKDEGITGLKEFYNDHEDLLETVRISDDARGIQLNVCYVDGGEDLLVVHIPIDDEGNFMWEKDKWDFM